MAAVKRMWNSCAIGARTAVREGMRSKPKEVFSLGCYAAMPFCHTTRNGAVWKDKTPAVKRACHSPSKAFHILRKQSVSRTPKRALKCIVKANADTSGFKFQARALAVEVHEEEETRKILSDSEEVQQEEVQQEGGSSVFTDFGLCEEVIKGLESRGFTGLFPIQEAVLPDALSGRDIIARARTGTGKTLAFAIPIVERLLKDASFQKSTNSGYSRRQYRKPKALVLAPTRELAMQVESELKATAGFLFTTCLYGGTSISKQERVLRGGVDIVVGTPGRIIDLLERGALDVSEVVYAVLDEADQMLSIGFEEDVEHIYGQLPQERQNMLFSATMPSWVKNLADKYLIDPATIDLVGDKGTGKMAETVETLAIKVSKDTKLDVLADLIQVYGKGGKTICFTETKRGADEVAAVLSRSLACEALHGDCSQGQREKTIRAFRNGLFNVLVATDVAARGLDINDVEMVVHFDLPQDSEAYLHRSGRTGRAGKTGISIAMYQGNRTRALQDLAHRTKSKFRLITPPTREELISSSSEQAINRLNMVHPDVLPHFETAAAGLIDNEGAVTTLAKALAALSGFREPPAARSAMTYEEGMVTIQMTCNDTPVRNIGEAARVLGRICNQNDLDYQDIGRIDTLRDGTTVFFDVPVAISEKIEAINDDFVTFGSPTLLPQLFEEDLSRSRGYSDRGRGDGRRRSGNYRSGGRGGYGGGNRDSRGGGYRRERSGGYNRNNRNGGGRRYNDRYEGGGGGGGGGERRNGGWERRRSRRDTSNWDDF